MYSTALKSYKREKDRRDKIGKLPTKTAFCWIFTERSIDRFLLASFHLRFSVLFRLLWNSCAFRGDERRKWNESVFCYEQQSKSDTPSIQIAKFSPLRNVPNNSFQIVNSCRLVTSEQFRPTDLVRQPNLRVAFDIWLIFKCCLKLNSIAAIWLLHNLFRCNT